MPELTPEKLVVFDCDGTLVDSQHGIIAAMREAFREHGMDDPDDKNVRRVVGLPLEVAVSHLMPDTQKADPATVANSYRRSSQAQRQQPMDYDEAMYPSMKSVLEDLSKAGYLMGVATGKSRRGLQLTVKQHDIAHHFVTLKSADDGPGKPHPAILQDAMAEAGAVSATTIMIGDTTYDIEMAVNANTLSIGVAWGYHDVQELLAAGATCIADRVEDLPALIKQLYRGVS